MKNFASLACFMAALTPPTAGSLFAQGAVERSLATGDFDLLNEIFENASIILPEQYEVSEKVGIATLNMNIRNLRCYDFSVGNITVAHEDVSATAHEVDVAMKDLDLTCEMDYDYKYGVLSGDGWVQIRTDGNSASTTVLFTSMNFDQAFPVESSVEQCYSDVEIERMDFEGDLASEIVEIFQGFIRNVVENAIGDVVCSELSQIGTTLVGNMVHFAETKLEPYLGDLGESYTDPLFPERNLNLPSDFPSLNLQDPDGSVSKAFNEILHFADTSLGSSASGPDGISGGGDLAINAIMRSLVLDEDRALTVNVSNIPTLEPILFEGHDRVTQFTITLNQVRIFGLDSFTRFDSFRNIGRYTIQNDFTWESLLIELDVSVDIKPSASDDAILQNSTSPGISERISMGFTVNQVDVKASFLLVLDEKALDNMQLGSLFYTKNLLPCLLSVVHSVEVSGLDVDPKFVSEPYLSGFVSPGLKRLLTDAAGAAFAMYSAVLRNAIPNIFQSSIREMINDSFLDSYGSKSYSMALHDSCSTLTLNSDQSFVDLRDLLRTVTVAQELGGSGLSQYGDLFRTMLGIVQNLVKTDGTTGLSALNAAVVEPLTQAISNKPGMLFQTHDLFNGETQVKVGALDAKVIVRAYDAKVENLNSIGNPLGLFGGVMDGPYNLNNTVTFGVSQEPLKFSLDLLLDLDGSDDLQIRNEMSFGLELFNATAMLTTMTKIAEARLAEFPLRDIFNLNCWLATIPAPLLDSYGIRSSQSPATAGIASLEATIGQLLMTAQCTNCSSPRMAELTELLSDPVAQTETTEVANALLSYVTQLMGGNFVQVQLDRLLNDAARKCPHNPSYNPEAEAIVYNAFEAPDTDHATSYLILLGVLAITGIILLSAVVFAIGLIVRKRHKKWVATLPPYQIKRLVLQQVQEASGENILNSSTTSMFKSKHVPLLFRLGIPLIILVNIGLFLSGHLSLGATVNIEGEVAGETFTLENFLEFSIARSTIDIWNAGGRALAILILIFSGLWPYAKLVMTLVLWFVPPSSVSVSCRGSLLIWLDWLAKWSMIDIFVLVISIGAFRVSIASPKHLPEDFYSVEMMVIPLWGLYANMLAQLVSQISSHVIIHYHRKVCFNARIDSSAELGSFESPTRHNSQAGDVQIFRADMGKGQERAATLEELPVARSDFVCFSKSLKAERLSNHHFSRPHRGETEKLVTRKFVNRLLLVLAFSLVLLVIIGSVVPSFSLKLLGLVGVAVEYGQDFEDATRYHSIFSVVKLLFEEASHLGRATDYLGLGILSLLFLCTLLLVPILQTGMLLIQWFAESTPLQKERMAVKLEVLQVWQYLEVYLVALFVSSWQLGPVSDFMINSYCENLENMFAQIVYYGVLKEEDAQCFSVTSHIEYGALFLALGAAILGFLSNFVSKATVQYLKDDKERLSRRMELERCNTSVDDTLHSDEGEMADDGLSGRIHPPPALFTDSFRWMLKTEDILLQSSRALFGDANNSHWSLPEARAVTVESPDETTIKGTYVSDLDLHNRKISGSLPVLEGLANATSKEKYQPKLSPRRLTYDESKIEVHSSLPQSSSYRQNEQSMQALDMDQQSIPSKMSSVDSSFKDEASLISETESLNYSLPSSAYQSSQTPRPPEFVRKASLGSPSASMKKTPPSSFYRLASLQQPASFTATASPFASYFEQQEDNAEKDDKPEAKKTAKTKNLRKPPPCSIDIKGGLKRAPQPMLEESDDEFTQVSIEHSEVTSDYFKTQPTTSRHSRTGLI